LFLRQLDVEESTSPRSLHSAVRLWINGKDPNPKHDSTSPPPSSRRLHPQIFHSPVRSCVVNASTKIEASRTPPEALRSLAFTDLPFQPPNWRLRDRKEVASAARRLGQGEFSSEIRLNGAKASVETMPEDDTFGVKDVIVLHVDRGTVTERRNIDGGIWIAKPDVWDESVQAPLRSKGPLTTGELSLQPPGLHHHHRLGSAQHAVHTLRSLFQVSGETSRRLTPPAGPSKPDTVSRTQCRRSDSQRNTIL
jgi:hypothetical protein